MAKVKKWLTGFYTLLFLIIFCIVMFVDKKIEYSCKNGCSLSNIALFIVGSFLALITVACFNCFNRWFAYYLQKLSKRESYLFLIIANILLLVVQLYILKNIYFETGWDCSVLAWVSDGLAYNNFDINAGFPGDYFSTYPNNLWLTFVLAIIKKIDIGIGLDTPYVASILVGIIGVNISIFYLAIIVKEITGSRLYSGLAWIIAAGYIGLSPWCIIPYSDVFALFFTVVILYLYVRKVCSKYFIWRWFLITMISFIGYKIKPSVMIVWISILINTLIQIKSRKEWIQKGWKMAVIVGICGLLTGGITNMIKDYIGFVPDDNKRFTVTHFAMMGLNEISTGAYYHDDVLYSASFPNVEERVNGNLIRIKERMISRGFVKNLYFFIQKLLMNYNDGSFAWTKEGGFFQTIPPVPNIFISSYLRHFYYAENNTTIYDLACNIVFECNSWMELLEIR